MTLQHALEIVLGLADDNSFDPAEHRNDEGLYELAEEQQNALEVVADFLENLPDEKAQEEALDIANQFRNPNNINPAQSAELARLVRKVFGGTDE